MQSVEMFLIYRDVSLQDKFLCCRFQNYVFDKPTQQEANISNHKQYFIPIVDIIRSLFWMLSVYSAALSNVYHAKIFKRCLDLQLCMGLIADVLKCFDTIRAKIVIKNIITKTFFLTICFNLLYKSE